MYITSRDPLKQSCSFPDLDEEEARGVTWQAGGPAGSHPGPLSQGSRAPLPLFHGAVCALRKDRDRKGDEESKQKQFAALTSVESKSAMVVLPPG